MAKKNVFPVCSPNVLEFSKENAIVIFEEAPQAYRLFHTDGSWGQLLIGEASQEEWGLPGDTLGEGWFHFGFTTGPVGNVGAPVLDPPPAGTVICVGVKDKLTSTFDSEQENSRTSSPLIRSMYFDFGFNFLSIKTDESPSDFYADPYWVTYMFDGNTWQILGSNNWV